MDKNINCNCEKAAEYDGHCVECEAPWSPPKIVKEPEIFRQFNLADALRGARVVCRTGERVHSIARLKDRRTMYQIVGVIEGQDVISNWLPSGSFVSSTMLHGYDLFIVGLLDGSGE